MTQQSGQIEQRTNPDSTLLTTTVGVLAVILAVDAALTILPAFLPGMVESIQSENAKIFWYLSRGSAVTAYVLLWMSMVLGLLLSNRLAKHWPGAAAANDVHQFVSLLGLGLVIFHAVILTGDSYMKLGLAQILIPFSGSTYRPIQVAFGQFAVYIWIIVAASFYVKKRIGIKSWKFIHFFSFVLFLIAMIHGITSGTDSGEIWMQVVYWGSAASVLFLTVNRVLMAIASKVLE
jgi:predicted ferric reductase